MIKVTRTPPSSISTYDQNIMSIARTSMKTDQADSVQLTYKQVVTYIKKFEADLDNNHEIGAQLASFGRDIRFRLTHVSYSLPDIISFRGIDEKGNRVQLIQNTSQLNFFLMAMKKLQDKPRRLGFDTDKMQDEL